MNLKDSREHIEILKLMQGYDYGYPAQYELEALKFAIECIETLKEEIKNRPYIVG